MKPDTRLFRDVQPENSQRLLTEALLAALDTAAPLRRPGRLPNFPPAFKRKVVEATFQPGASVSSIAREHAQLSMLLEGIGLHQLMRHF